MKAIFSIIVTLCSAFSVMAQNAPPSTEIYLLDLSVKKDKVTISHGVNITKHKGYDNQPSFHPDQPILYYSSFNEDGRSDIRTYNYKSNQTTSLTTTQEREYSPLVTPDKQYVSCIIQRDNGAQDLGKYPVEGGEPSLIIDHLTIGYHVWTDNSHLGLFVLGQPNSLHYLLLPMKRDTIISTNIGRSLYRVPGETAFSYIQKYDGQDWKIMKFNTRTRKISTIGPSITAKEDMCWTPDGKILMSDGAKLFFMTPGGKPGWTEVIVSGDAGFLKDITRLSVSHDGKKLAIVVEE